jgi:hypothetical protein
MVVTLLESETSDLRELCRIAGGDPSTFYRGTDLRSLDLSDADREYFQKSQVSDAVYRIKAAVRQEERIAIILDQILLNRDIGISALLQHSGEKAKFAKNAAEVIGQKFNSKDTDDSNDELIAASLIQRLYTDVFPYNRGSLLYFLAKHLGKYPAINAAITKCMNRSGSMFVEKVRPDIELLLRESRTHPENFDIRRNLRSGNYLRSENEESVTVRVLLEYGLDDSQRQIALDKIRRKLLGFGTIVNSSVHVTTPFEGRHFYELEILVISGPGFVQHLNTLEQDVSKIDGVHSLVID